MFTVNVVVPDSELVITSDAEKVGVGSNDAVLEGKYVSVSVEVDGHDVEGVARSVSVCDWKLVVVRLSVAVNWSLLDGVLTYVNETRTVDVSCVLLASLLKDGVGVILIVAVIEGDEVNELDRDDGADSDANVIDNDCDVELDKVTVGVKLCDCSFESLAEASQEADDDAETDLLEESSEVKESLLVRDFSSVTLPVTVYDSDGDIVALRVTVSKSVSVIVGELEFVGSTVNDRDFSSVGLSDSVSLAETCFVSEVVGVRLFVNVRESDFEFVSWRDSDALFSDEGELDFSSDALNELLCILVSVSNVTDW